MALHPGARIRVGADDWRDEDFEPGDEEISGVVAKCFVGPWLLVLLEDDADGERRWIHLRLAALGRILQPPNDDVEEPACG